MKCFVSTETLAQHSHTADYYDASKHSPCVTKLPKFLPTIQCHVAPALESNCIGGVSLDLLCTRSL